MSANEHDDDQPDSEDVIERLREALTENADHWRWIIKAYPNSGASATAERALAAIDDALNAGVKGIV